MAGWRQRSTREMALGFVKNAPSARHPEALQGYMSALYHLHANETPRAHGRDPETTRVQKAVRWALSELEIRLRRARGVGGPSLHARGTRRAHRATLRYEAEHGNRRRNKRGQFTRARR